MKMPALDEIIRLAGRLADGEQLAVPGPDGDPSRDLAIRRNDFRILCSTDAEVSGVGYLVTTRRPATDWYGSASIEDPGEALADVVLFFEVLDPSGPVPDWRPVGFGTELMSILMRGVPKFLDPDDVGLLAEAERFASRWGEMIADRYLPTAGRLAASGGLGKTRALEEVEAERPPLRVRRPPEG